MSLASAISVATVGTTIPEGERLEFAVPQRALRYFDGTTGARRL